MALCADEAQDITGQVFFVYGGAVTSASLGSRRALLGGRLSWDADELLQELRTLPRRAPGRPGMMAMMQKAGGQAVRAR